MDRDGGDGEVDGEGDGGGEDGEEDREPSVGRACCVTDV